MSPIIVKQKNTPRAITAIQSKSRRRRPKSLNSKERKRQMSMIGAKMMEAILLFLLITDIDAAGVGIKAFGASEFHDIGGGGIEFLLGIMDQAGCFDEVVGTESTEISGGPA